MGSSLIDTVHPFAVAEGINETAIPFVRLFKASGLSQPLHAVYEPSLFIILQGSKRVTIAHRSYVYDSDSYLVSSVRLPVSGQILGASPEAPFLSIQILFDPLSIHAMAETMNASGISDSRETVPGISTHALDPVLLEAVSRLVGLLEQPDDREVLAPLYHREILYRLLRTQPLPTLRQFAAPDAHAVRISKALRRLHADFFEPVNIAQLAEEAEMSAAAFHKHFKTLTSMSPMQYRKIHRLQEAKRLMMTENLEASEAAFRVGYESPSHFSREYARYFGLPPGKDLKRSRESFTDRA